jgi:hypothetical protein
MTKKGCFILHTFKPCIGEGSLRFADRNQRNYSYKRSTQILAFADDVVTVGRSIDKMKKTKKKVMKTEQVMGLNGQHAKDKRH